YVNLVCDFLEFLPYDIIIQRLVGDAPMGRLIAPLWSLEKTDILMAVDAKMERRDSYQGVRS
ncbi:MAG: TIGR01212 family radical SAM protein, partial [Nitrospinota bacterium]